MLDFRRKQPSQGRRLVKSHRDAHWYDSKRNRAGLAALVSTALVVIPLVASRAVDDPTVTIATTQATASTATTLNADIDNFPTSADLIAVVILTENDLQCTQVSSCGALQLPSAQRTNLTALLNHSWDNTVRLGFRGSNTNVTAALAAFQWTPPAFNDTSTSTYEIQVSVTEVPADSTNLFYEPFQDHWYRWVQNGGGTPTNITWMQARMAARDSVLSTGGLRGYLGNITSATENDFIQNYTNAQNIWIGAADAGLAHPSFDPTQATNTTANLVYTDDDNEEGMWRWADGPEHGQAFYRVMGCSQGIVAGVFTHWQSCLSNSAGWSASTPSINTSVLGAVTNETVSRRTSGSWVVTKIGALRTAYSGDAKAFTRWALESDWNSLTSPSAQTWGTEPNTYNSNENSVSTASANWPPGENAAVTNWGGNNGNWNDLHQSNLDDGINVSRYLIEYGGTNCSPSCGTNTLATASVTQRVTTLPSTFVSSCQGAGSIQNGSFENPSSGDPSSWRTTATDGAFERWGAGRSVTTGSINDPASSYAANGSFLMELQANSPGGSNQGLYQDINTIPGTVVRWSYKHHFREGLNSNADQIAAAVIGPTPQGLPAGSIWTSTEQASPFGASAPSGLITGNSNYSTSPYQKTVDAAPRSTNSWRTSSGTYTVPTGQNTTRFLFAAIQSPANGYGNLIDDVTFTPTLACPMTLTIVKDRSRTVNLLSNSQTSGSDWSYYAPQGANAISVIRGPSEVTRTFGSATSANSPITLQSSTVGSYSMLYKVTDSFSQVSYSNLTINVVDEVDVKAPAVIPVDPKATAITLPTLPIDQSNNIQLCIDQVDSATATSSSATIASPNVSIAVSGTLVSSVTTALASNVRTFSGPRASVAEQTGQIRISANSGRLVTIGQSKFIRIRATSTDDGTTSCSSGTVKVIELRALNLDVTKLLNIRLD